MGATLLITEISGERRSTREIELWWQRKNQNLPTTMCWVLAWTQATMRSRRLIGSLRCHGIRWVQRSRTGSVSSWDIFSVCKRNYFDCSEGTLYTSYTYVYCWLIGSLVQRLSHLIRPVGASMPVGFWPSPAGLGCLFACTIRRQKSLNIFREHFVWIRENSRHTENLNAKLKLWFGALTGQF